MATKEQIVKIYTGYYDRAADSTGLAYWVENGADMTEEQIAQSFAEQDETKAAYPDELTTPAFVNTIYNNVFNRDADADGLDFWVKALEAGDVTKPEMILAVMNGAQGDDKVILDNKVEVSTYFADKGQDGYDDAVEALDDVDETDASVIAAKDAINELAPLALTPNKDTLVGTEGDDNITGTDTTYTAGDSIDGGEGNDTFSIKMAAAFAPDPNAIMTNVENVVITPTAAVPAFSTANWSGVENITVAKAAAFAVTIDDIGSELNSFTVSGATGAQATTVNFIGDMNSTKDDTFNFTLDNANATGVVTLVVPNTTTASNLVEHFDITTSKTVAGSGVTLTAAETAAKDVTLHGDGPLTLVTNAASTQLSKVDASDMNGIFTYVGTTATGQTIYGGSKADVLSGAAGADTFIGGKGADAITVGAQDAMKVLYKDDSESTTATSDVITAFTTGANTIDIVGVGAGSLANTIIKTVAASITTIEAAVAEANKGDIVGKTYITYDNGTDSFFMYDMDNDGTIDGAMQLLAVTGAASFAVTDII